MAGLLWATSLILPGWVGAETRLTVLPSFSLEEAYTDNLFLSESVEEEDIITVFSPGARFEMMRKTLGISLDYRLGFSRYQRFSEYDSIRHNADLAAWWSLSRFSRLEFTNRFQVSEDPAENVLDDPYESSGVRPETSDGEAVRVETETVRRSRDRFLTNDTEIRYVHQFGRNDTLSFAYRYGILRNEDPTVRNRESQNPAITLLFWPVPRRLQMDARVDYARDDLDDALGEPGYLEERVSPGVNLTYWLLPGQFALRGGLEYTRGVSWDEGILLNEGERFGDNWYESLIPSAGLTYRWIPGKMAFDLDMYRERAVTYGNDGLSDPADDFETSEGTFRATRFLRRNLDVFAEYTFGQTDFFRDDGGNEDFFFHGPTLGFDYRIREDLPLALSVGYLVRDQERSGREDAITFNGSVGEWEFVRDATLRFSAESGYNQSNLGAERLGFGFYYDAYLVLGYRIDHRWTAEASARYQRNRFLDYEDNRDPFGETRDDRVQEYGAGFVYRPRRWATLRLRYVYRTVESTEPGDSYRENRVTLQVGLTPARPIPFH